MKVNYCLVGAGISALYCAYLIKKHNPQATLVILEKDRRIGGRVYPVKFNGSTVLLGSGVGRASSDKLLMAWLDELGIEYHKYPKVFQNQDSRFLRSCFQKLRQAKQKFNRHQMNFREYAIRVLGYDNYQLFCSHASFTDFEEADFIDTVDHYGFDDLIPVGYNFSVPWVDVLKKAVQTIGRENFILGAEVLSVERNSVKFRSGAQLSDVLADTIICCCPVPVLKKLYPRHRLLNNVGTQTFTRIYAYLDKPLPINSYYVTHNVFQKIIPINMERNLYMIVYSDNWRADTCNRMSKRDLEKELHALFKQQYKILKMKKHYWQVGTHFFYPLPPNFRDRDAFISKIQKPRTNHFLIGEAFSNNQGWVEGALESVRSAPVF